MTPRDTLLLQLIGRGNSLDDLFEELRIGYRCGLAGYFQCDEPGDLGQILRGMENRDLIECVGFEVRPRAAVAERQSALW